MVRSELYNLIRKTVNATIPGSRVILFGSQAKNSSDAKSDFDLLVITPNVSNTEEKKRWYRILDKIFVEQIKIPVDLIISNEKEVLEKQKLPGNIIRTVLREGISL
jgi:predicted nucleotidyltransferase